MTARFSVNDIIACPSCKGGLQETKESYLCTACRLKFRVSDGIPVMLPDEAQPVSTSDLNKDA